MKWLRRRAALCSCLLVSPYSMASALQDVIAALAAEQAAPSVRTVLKLDKAGVTRVDVIERTPAGRMRIVFDAERSANELVVINDATYRRGRTGWTRSPSAPPPALIPSIARLFSKGLSEVRELSSTGPRRTFTGRMAWSNGGVGNEGIISLAINRVSRLPEELRFEGKCGTTPCAFTQSFHYDQVIVIEAPQ